MKMVMVFLLALFSLAPLEATRRWSLKFNYEKPEYIRVQDSTGELLTYWYMVYSLTNPTERDLHISVELKVVTDDDHVYYNSLYPGVEKLIEAQKNQKFFNVLEMKGDDLSGTIAAGETKLGIALFGRVDGEMDIMNVHVTGLVDVVSHEGTTVYKEVKVFILTYERKGDEFNRHLDLLHYVRQDWLVTKREEIRKDEKKSE
ncbi:MAG: hypothetical protein AABZ60_15205 [Planctomycetota bacterium]